MKTTEYTQKRFDTICKGCRYRDGMFCTVRPHIVGQPLEETWIIPPSCPRYNQQRQLRSVYHPEQCFDQDVTATCVNNLGVEAQFDNGVEYLVADLNFQERFLSVQDKFGRICQMDPGRFRLEVPGYGTLDLSLIKEP